MKVAITLNEMGRQIAEASKRLTQEQRRAMSHEKLMQLLRTPVGRRA